MDPSVKRRVAMYGHLDEHFEGKFGQGDRGDGVALLDFFGSATECVLELFVGGCRAVDIRLNDVPA